MKINAFLMLLAAIPMITNCAAEPQSPPWKELPEIPVKRIGKYLKSDKDFLAFALLSPQTFAALRGKPFAKRKSTALLRYWQNPTQVILEQKLGPPGYYTKARAFSPDGRLLAYGRHKGFGLLEVTAQKKAKEPAFDRSRRSSQFVFVKPDRTHLHLISQSANYITTWNVIRIDDPDHYTLIKVNECDIPDHPSSTVVAFSHDGQLRAVP